MASVRLGVIGVSPAEGDELPLGGRRRVGSPFKHLEPRFKWRIRQRRPLRRACLSGAANRAVALKGRQRPPCRYDDVGGGQQQEPAPSRNRRFLSFSAAALKLMLSYRAAVFAGRRHGGQDGWPDCSSAKAARSNCLRLVTRTPAAKAIRQQLTDRIRSRPEYHQ